MLKTVEKVLLLQDLDLFRLASTEDLARFALVAKEKALPAGKQVFKKGENPTQLHVLISGKVKLDQGSNGSLLVERTVLDFLSVFSESPHVFSASTVEHCTLLVVSYDDLVDLMTAEAEFCWAVVRFLAQQGRELARGLQLRARQDHAGKSPVPDNSGPDDELE